MVTESYQLMRIVLAFGDATVGQRWAFKWFHHFKERDIFIRSDMSWIPFTC